MMERQRGPAALPVVILSKLLYMAVVRWLLCIVRIVMLNSDTEKSQDPKLDDERSDSIYAKAVKMSEDKPESPDQTCSICKGLGHLTTVTTAGGGRIGYGMHSHPCWYCAVLTIGDPPWYNDESATNIINRAALAKRKGI